MDEDKVWLQWTIGLSFALALIVGVGLYSRHGGSHGLTGLATNVALQDLSPTIDLLGAETISHGYHYQILAVARLCDPEGAFEYHVSVEGSHHIQSTPLAAALDAVAAVRLTPQEQERLTVFRAERQTHQQTLDALKEQRAEATRNNADIAALLRSLRAAAQSESDAGRFASLQGQLAGLETKQREVRARLDELGADVLRARDALDELRPKIDMLDRRPPAEVRHLLDEARTVGSAFVHTSTRRPLPRAALELHGLTEPGGALIEDGKPRSGDLDSFSEPDAEGCVRILMLAFSAAPEATFQIHGRAEALRKEFGHECPGQWTDEGCRIVRTTQRKWVVTALIDDEAEAPSITNAYHAVDIAGLDPDEDEIEDTYHAASSQPARVTEQGGETSGLLDTGAVLLGALASKGPSALRPRRGFSTVKAETASGVRYTTRRSSSPGLPTYVGERITEARVYAQASVRCRPEESGLFEPVRQAQLALVAPNGDRLTLGAVLPDRSAKPHRLLFENDEPYEATRSDGIWTLFVTEGEGDFRAAGCKIHQLVINVSGQQPPALDAVIEADSVQDRPSPPHDSGLSEEQRRLLETLLER